MRLIPDVEPHMQGRRDYVSEDGHWKLARERVKHDTFRWRVQSRDGDGWRTLATFQKRRDARNHLEDLAGPPMDEEHDEQCERLPRRNPCHAEAGRVSDRRAAP